MSHTENVERARRAWNAGHLDDYLTLYDDAISLHGYSPVPLDKAQGAGFYGMIWTAFAADGKPSPDLAFHETLEDGDLYSCRFTMSGTHRAEFMGIPATGRRYRLEGMTIMRFAGDQVIERWSTSDFLGLLIQLGAFPPPPA
jgi:predicted ester cyclase